MSDKHTHTRYWIVGILLVIAGLLGACSGIKTYPNDLAKNLLVKTETDSGSMFSKVRAAVDIYDVDTQCELHYQGTVQLDEQQKEIGVAAGKTSYLVFAFASSSFFGGTSSTITSETLLKPRQGYHYDVDVSYRDDIYYVGITERKARKSKGRELSLRPLASCNS